MQIKIKETGEYHTLVLRDIHGNDITANMLNSFADSDLEGDTMTKETFNWWAVRLNELQFLINDTSKQGRDDISSSLYTAKDMIKLLRGGD
jgi:hypothetical protein